MDPLVIDLEAREMGYYHVPPYMADQSGDLTFQVPLRTLIAIDSWVHIFIADVVFGLFSRGARYEKRVNEDLAFKLGLLATALYEGRQLLECSAVVKVGKNCVIYPSATIYGPTTIGDNVHIDAGVVIDNCIIGNNVNISQDVQLMLSVVGDGAFLRFRAALFMTAVMENSMFAQNTCLQMCVVGRNTFIGAGSTFTDYNLIPAPLRALDGKGRLNYSNLDLIVANDVSQPGAGFGAGTNAVVLLRRDGTRRDVPLAAKREVAERILDEVVALRRGAAVPTPA